MAKKKKISLAKKIILSVCALVVCFVAFIVFVFLYSGNTKPILNAADTFQPGDSWSLISERIEPPRMVCISGQCPYVQRRYEGPILSKEDFFNKVQMAGWIVNGSSLSSCDDFFFEKRGQTTCSVDGRIRNSNFTFRIYLSNEGNRAWLSVHISEHF